MDRILGVVFAVFLFVGAISALASFTFSWPWILLAVWIVGLVFWARSGFTTIPIGWRGQLLFIGERIAAELGEGLRWTPWPFGLKLADCRQITLNLGTLEAITKDNVPVVMDSTVMYRVVELDKFFEVEEVGLKRALDDSRTQVLRAEVRALPLESVLDLHEQLAEQVKGVLEHKDWGIDVVEVIIPEIKPEGEVAKDLALKKREELQKAGQEVEFQLFIDRVKAGIGARLTREQAIEQAQLTIGKASKSIDAKTIALDSATAEVVARILGRK